MKVVIVAKTRMGGGACVGAITFEGQSVRLMTPDQEFRDHFNLEYAIGDVWELDAAPPETLKPPHVENVVVQDKRLMRRVELPRVVGFIEKTMPPATGSPDALFDGFLRRAPWGPLYVAEPAVPCRSTMFWRPDRDLARDEEGKRIRYRYPTEDGGRTLTFVGLQEPVDVIPAGTLLRVSLAHWWRPRDMPDHELRCYVQLSGWYELDPAAPSAAIQGGRAGRPSTALCSAQDAPRSAQDAPRSAQDAPRSAQDAPRPAQDAPRPAQDAPRSAQDAPRSDPESRPDQDAARLQPESRVAPPLVESPLTAARSLLKSVFGYDDFLPLQEKVIANVLARRDTLAIMPTGGGKSMCYQLPALLFEGLTLVVSPLIALMQDQVDALRALGISAAYLNSTVDYHTYVATTNDARGGKIKLLYMAPETLLRPETLVMLDRAKVDCITIDEAHCISSWGHDFRPEYRQLLSVRQRLPRAVCLALTATATKRVQDDIKDVLGFGAGNTFVASFNRPNLHLSIQQRTARLPQIMAFLNAHRDESGIIYTNRRKDAEALAEQLTQLGRPALPYHAGMDDALRREHQRRFTRDEAQIIVATIAFGMGINKSNVRFILHTALPENLENYYQQIGRAGRDGLPADCLLLWSYADVKIIRKFISDAAAEEQPGKEARLQAMLRYAEGAGCRRVPLLAYFGERVGGNCAACDHCAPRTVEAPAVIAREAGIPPLPRASEAAAEAVNAATAEFVKGLFEELRKLRLQLAREAHLPPFVVFSDKTLQEMAQKRPQTEAELRQVSGVGDHKLATYGAQFIQAIQAYCAAHGAAAAAQPGPATVAASPTGSERRTEIAELFNSGVEVGALARLLGVKISTILQHIGDYYSEGHPVDAPRLLPHVKASAALQGDAFALFAELGTEQLRLTYHALGGKVSYDDLRLLRIYFESQHATGGQEKRDK